MNSSRIIYQPRRDATTESEVSVLAAVYRFVQFNSQARRGGQHDLTSNSTTEMLKIGPRKTEQEKT